MQVVDGEQNRATDTQVDGQPVQPVQGRERRVGVVVAVRTQFEHGARRACRAREHRLIATRQRGFEELAHHAERELALQLSPTRSHDPHTRGGRSSPGLGQQPGLADASRALDEPDAGLTGNDGVDERLERRELLLPLQ